MAASAPPTAAFLQRLEPEQRAEFRNAMLEHWSGFCDGGRVREPREYLVVVGTRR